MNDGTITLDLLVKPEPGTAAALTLRQHYAGLALNALVARDYLAPPPPPAPPRGHFTPAQLRSIYGYTAEFPMEPFL